MNKSSLTFFLILFILSVQSIAQFENDLEKAKNLLMQGNHEQGNNILHSIISNNPPNSLIHFLIGKTYFANKMYDLALLHFEKSISLENNNGEFYYWLGLTYKEKIQTAGFFEKADYMSKLKDCLQLAVKLDPENPDYRYLLGGFYLKAPGLLGGSIQKAKNEADYLLKISPVKGFDLYAQIHLENDNFEDAILSYKKLIDLDPLNPNNYFQIGMLYQNMKIYDMAFNYFEDAIKADTLFLKALYQIGRTAVFAKNNISRGIESLLKYLQLKLDGSVPQYDAAHWRLGMLFEINGDFLNAKYQYDKAVQLNPQNEEYKKSLKALLSKR